MAADTYMSICIELRLSLKTKTRMVGEDVKEVMGTDEGGGGGVGGGAAPLCGPRVCECACHPCTGATEGVGLMSVGRPQSRRVWVAPLTLHISKPCRA